MTKPPTHSPLDAARALAKSDVDAAMKMLTDVVSTRPDDAEARHMLGMLLVEQGRFAQALPHFERAVAIAPEAVPLLNNLGALYEQLRRLDDAIACYQRATTLAPSAAVPHANLGLALRAARRFAEATAALRIAATLDPDMVEAWAALGGCLAASGSPTAALGALRRAVALDPNQADAWRDLGSALHSLGCDEEALRCLQRSTDLRPEDFEAWFALGSAQAAMGAHAAAASAFGRGVALRPASGAALHEQGKALFELGCVEQAMPLLRRAAAVGDEATKRQALENLAVIVPGSPVDDPRSIRATREAHARALPDLPRKARPGRGAGAQPYRVGYLSSFFHRDPWMKPVWGLIQHHDRTKVEVHLLVDGPTESLGSHPALQRGDRIEGIGSLTNEAAARAIAERELDVLVDLNGYSVPGRLPIYLYRTARVTVGWFNYYATSGLRCFDALVGDSHVVHADEERFFTERIVRVPHSYLAFSVNHATPELVAPPSCSGAPLTFGSLASQYKLTDVVVRTWAAILRRCPGSLLLLRNASLERTDHRLHLAERFAREGVGAERLILEGRAPHLEFLATYDRIDVALDPFPYGGGTTTTEALWQGVPVVSWNGDRWASRTSVSLLRAAGLDEYVVGDLVAYVDLCARLAAATDTRAKLQRFRADARELLSKSPACDAPGLARAMESIYQDLLR